jgi:DNA helicase MCM8
MIRLAEARARCELREIVTAADARDVVAIMKHSLWESYDNGRGGVEIARSQNGAGMSKSAECKAFATTLMKIAEQKGSKIFYQHELQELSKCNIMFTTDNRQSKNR